MSLNMEYIGKLYADAVVKGKRTLDSVPETIREQVSKLVEESKNA